MLHFASINIERSRHLERVKSFCNDFNFDAVCLQEVNENDLPFLQSVIGDNLAWAPMTYFITETEPANTPMGVAILSKHPLTQTVKHYYVGQETPVPHIQWEKPGHPISSTMHKALLCTSVTCNGETYRLGTTHFTWTCDGAPNQQQEIDLAAMLKSIEKEGEIVLAGDFNASRGQATFDHLAHIMKDNIPSRYLTSIDSSLHRAGFFGNRMVDGLFTTPSYKAENVLLHTGVSDHMAITATLSRR